MLILWGSNLYGQVLEVKNPKAANKYKTTQCLNIIKEVDSIPLRCDTVFIKPWDKDSISYEFKGLYFDERNQLRKYHYELAIRDGSHDHTDFSVYYDRQGNLVYITSVGWNHCSDNSWWLYVWQRRIVDYYYTVDCGCCDEEITEKSWGIVRPIVGNVINTNFHGYSLKGLIDSRTFLESKSYNED